MAKTLLVVALLLVAVVGRSSAELSADEQKKCQTEVTKLMDCLSYAQKSTNEPTAKCCSSVSDIRTADFACLCYLLAATLKGDDTVKQLNLDSSRMLALPTVCKLQNTSVSDCPAQLKLSPNSPDYALFNSSTTPGTPPTASPPTASPPTASTASPPTASPPTASPTTTTTTPPQVSTTTTTTTTSAGSPSLDAYSVQLPFSSFAIYAVSVAAFFVIFLTWP